MNNVMGLIITGGRKDNMGEIVAKRSVSAIPVGGKFRAIDFALSNMVNSGIDKIGLITQYSFRSLMDHLGSGKEWDLDRKNEGLFIFPPYLAGENSGWYKGSADGMYSNITFLERSREEYVLISSGNCVYKTRYKDFLESHIESGADMSIMYRDMTDIKNEMHHFGNLTLNEEDRIVDFLEKPLHPKGVLASMGVYLIKRELLIDLLQESNARSEHDFVRDIVIKNVGNLDIRGYKYEGYWRPMASIDLFYKTNMELLDLEVRNALFGGRDRIFTKVKDETPSKYNQEAQVTNSIIANGCIVEGQVENSVLFRGVRVEKGAKIKNAIIMQDSVIERDVTLENVIFDKEVHITSGRSLKGEASSPVIVGKRADIY